MTSRSKNSPKLRVLATPWTFQAYPSREKPWSAEKAVREVVKAGFDGLQSRSNHPMFEPAKRTSLLLAGNCDIVSLNEVEPKLRPFRDHKITRINVQLCDHDTSLEESLRIALRVMEVGDRYGIKPAIEWHRDTCTETPEKALALAAAYQKKTGKKLRTNFDHSHPAVIKHLHPGNYWERLGIRLDLLRMSELIHFRPFNGHHCQIPVTDRKGGLSPEFKAWIPFCEKVFEAWLSAAAPGRELYAVAELGTIDGYCLSCFPDRWKDKQVLMQEIRKAWNRQVSKW
jgi:hypothetical protein